jgi:5-methylthioadenosine/S-adenosylhomocysteine deaminase
VISRILLRGGTVVPVDPQYPDEFIGDVLIEGSRIAQVGPHIEVDPASAKVIDVTGGIVTPGFVDTHRHLWQSLLRYIGADWTIRQYGQTMFGRFGRNYTPDDMYVAVRLGLAEALDAGVTQILDWNHNLNSPAHCDEAIRAHRDSGARVILGYGQSAAMWLETYGPSGQLGNSPPSEDIRRVRDQYYSSGDQLLTLAVAARGPEKTSPEVVRAEWSQARDLGIRISVHVGNGVRGRVRPVDRLNEAGLLDSDTTYVHCNTLSDRELDYIAATGGSASCAPEIECNMGHGQPAVKRLLAAGVRPSLSVDTCANVGGELFSAMRTTLSVVRGVDHAAQIAAGDEEPFIALKSRDVLEFATIEGARANGLGTVSGSITPGKEADIVVFSCAAPNMYPMSHAIGTVVKGAHTGNVDTVFVAGRAVKLNGSLVDPDLLGLRARAESCRDRLFRQANGPGDTPIPRYPADAGY